VEQGEVPASFPVFALANRAFGKIDFLDRKTVNLIAVKPKIFRQQRFGNVPHPIGDTKRAELGEITVYRKLE